MSGPDEELAKELLAAMRAMRRLADATLKAVTPVEAYRMTQEQGRDGIREAARELSQVAGRLERRLKDDPSEPPA